MLDKLESDEQSILVQLLKIPSINKAITDILDLYEKRENIKELLANYDIRTKLLLFFLRFYKKNAKIFIWDKMYKSNFVSEPTNYIGKKVSDKHNIWEYLLLEVKKCFNVEIINRKNDKYVKIILN